MVECWLEPVPGNKTGAVSSFWKKRKWSPQEPDKIELGQGRWSLREHLEKELSAGRSPCPEWAGCFLSLYWKPEEELELHQADQELCVHRPGPGSLKDPGVPEQGEMKQLQQEV